jgi:UDP-N-acetylmuramate--alanine ligase
MFNSLEAIHFIGIGGIGMSGIAEILHNLGYIVQGSDTSSNANIARLKAKNIKIFSEHSPTNLQNVSVVVKSSAIKDSNSELIAARERHIPVVKRAEMLAELMRLKISIAIAGTHGKTTTTSLMAAMFETAGQKPTVINGGVINSHATNAYIGEGDYLIAEADESDGTFIKVPSTIGIITNIDPEHIDHYKNFENLRSAFKTFIEQLPFYGFGVLCNDHPEVKKMAEEIIDRKIITYGIESEANVRAVNIRNNIDSSDYDIEYQPSSGSKRIIRDIHLPIPGIHNVLNSLAVIAVALELKWNDDIVVNSFNNFQGVKRRFTTTGEVDSIRIIDDYAHHPKEIIATLKTAKNITNITGGRVIAVAQLHRYTRVHDLFSEFIHCFNDASILIMADIYPAGEEAIEGVSKEIIAASIKQSDFAGEVITLDSPTNLANTLSPLLKPKDIVICLGAGDITNWAYALPKELEKISEKKESFVNCA